MRAWLKRLRELLADARRPSVHIAKIEIVVSGQNDPERVARMVSEEIRRLAERTKSPS